MSEISPIVAARDLVAYLVRFPAECAVGTSPVNQIFDRYHVLEHVVVSDGITIDRERLIAHAAGSRRRVADVSVEVREALVDFPHVAAHYVLSAAMRRGQTVSTEIFAFGRLAPDRRLCRLDQVTRTIESRA